MSVNPLEPIEKNDPKLADYIEQERALAFEAGALSTKDKLLIAVAIDATQGAVNGVRSLTLKALDAGATKEEIMEALRVAEFICGAGSMYTAAAGLQDVL